MRLRDIILVAVTFTAIALGVLLPGPSSVLTPYTARGMMMVMFFNFLGIDFQALLRPGLRAAGEMAFWCVVKLVIVPALTYWVFLLIMPRWALPALVLCATATAVGVPFFAQMMGLETERLLQLLVFTSLAMPVTMPAMLFCLAGAQINIPFSTMFGLLAQVVFLPVGAVFLLRTFTPRLAEGLRRIAFPATLFFFFCINLGVFASYADFIISQAGEVLTALAAGCLLTVVQQVVIWLLAVLAGGRLDYLLGVAGIHFMNNVVALIFAARFFGVEAPLLAACFMVLIYPAPIFLRPLTRLRLAWPSSLAGRQPNASHGSESAAS